MYAILAYLRKMAGTPDAHDHWREKISQSPRLYSMLVAFATWMMANNCAVRRICRQGGVGVDPGAKLRGANVLL